MISLYDLERLDPKVREVLEQFAVQTQAQLNRIGRAESVAFNALNFRGSGAMTWTVAESNVSAYWVAPMGIGPQSVVTVGFRLANTTVGGTPGTTLLLSLPDKYTAITYARAVCRVSDNGTVGQGLIEIAPGSQTFSIFKSDLTNWSAATANTTVGGQIQVPVVRT